MKGRYIKTVNRIREKKAFTLAEALVAIIIMLMVSGIVVAGIPAAFRAYDNVFIASNAEVLLSTTATALRNELGTAKDVEVTGTTVNYYNEAFASYSEISLGRAESGETLPENESTIMYKRYAQDTELGNAASSPKRLISEATSGKKLFVTYSEVKKSKDGSYITFSGLEVKRIVNGSAVSTKAKRGSYSVRLFAGE